MDPTAETPGEPLLRANSPTIVNRDDLRALQLLVKKNRHRVPAYKPMMERVEDVSAALADEVRDVLRLAPDRASKARWRWAPRDPLQQGGPDDTNPLFTAGLSWEILNRTLYDLKFDWEWLADYLVNLARSWDIWNSLRSLGARKPRKQDTFDRLAGFIHQHMDLVLLVIETCNDVRRDEARVLECMDDLGAHAFKEQVQRLGYLEEELLTRIRRVCRLEDVALARTKEMVAHVLNAYRERAESSVAVNPIDPTQQMTEQSGINDLAVESASRLFREYACRPRIGSRFEAALGGGRTGEGREQRWRWHGIVTPSTGKDYGVVPEFQILFLPVDFKFHSHSKLPPLAHEAAHVVLDLIDRNESVRAEFAAEVLCPWITSARQIARQRLVDPLARQTPGEAAIGDDHRLARAQFNSVAGELARLVASGSERVALSREEWLCDVLGALAAGPAFHACLSLLVSRADRESLDWPGWLRIYAGRALASALGWYDPSAVPGCRDPWEVFGWMDDALQRHWFRKVTVAESEVDGLDGETGSGDLEEWALHAPFYLVKALEADPNVVLNLCRFAEGMGEDFLFYPHVDDAEVRGLVREGVNALCEETMARMMFNDELVLDVSPKIVAASTLLPPFGRPHHPPSRELHSLYYSSANSKQNLARVGEILGDQVMQRITIGRSLIHSQFQKN